MIVIGWKHRYQVRLCQPCWRIFRAPITNVESVVPAENKKISYIASGAMEGNQYLRKAHCMFGWDWGAQIPDAGIWRDIESAWHHWDSFQPHSDYLRADYIKQFEYVLPCAVEEVDDRTFF